MERFGGTRTFAEVHKRIAPFDGWLFKASGGRLSTARLPAPARGGEGAAVGPEHVEWSRHVTVNDPCIWAECGSQT